MALRTVVSLIPAGSITGEMLDPNSNLYYCVVRCATTANIADYATAAPDEVDEVTVTGDNLILVWKNTDQTKNGVLNVDTVGTGADGEWSRPTSRDETFEYPIGMLVYVKEGTENGKKLFKLTQFSGGVDSGNMVFKEQLAGFSVTNNGEPEEVGTGDSTTDTFDLSSANVVFCSVFVNGIAQPPDAYSITAGTGPGGVDQLVFSGGNIPFTAGVIEAILFCRV